jgi:hypothetical protein
MDFAGGEAPGEEVRGISRVGRAAVGKRQVDFAGGVAPGKK